MPTDRPAPAVQQDELGEQAPCTEGVAEGIAEAVPPGGTERSALEMAFGVAMRRTGSLMQLMGQTAAERIGINATDLNCLNILSLPGQMTAGQLAAATGLTTPSITAAVDRLEQAGYVRRERDARDRRRVVIHLIVERAMRDVAPVFLPMVRAWQETASGYSDAELKLILEFQSRTEQVLRDHLARLRGDLDAAQPSGRR
jgi:DNA-binding MarR family transcriptional regulator